MNNSLSKIENFICYFCFSILITFPIFQILSRSIQSITIFGISFDFFSIPGSQNIIQHMTLWIAFIGAVLAARSNKLLAITREPIFDKTSNLSSNFRMNRFVAHGISVGVVLSLAISYLKMIQIGIDYPDFITPFIPVWFAQSFIPIVFY